MSIPSFSVHKKVTVVMISLAVVLMGVVAFLKLPQEYFPQIKFPQITIVTDYPNAAPEEIETLITRPIEESIGSVSGLKRIESVSREGRSTILASFNWGQDIDFAALAIREKIDLVKERLPKESEDPVVLKFDPLASPVMILSVTGNEIDPVRLKFLTEKMLKERLEKLDGVASVTFSGGVTREILVEIDHPRLQANHLSLLEVVDSLDESNVSYPAGSIKKGLYEYLIRTVGEYRSAKEVEFTVLGTDTVRDIQRDDNSFLEKGAGSSRETLEKLRQELQKDLMEKRLILLRDVADVQDALAEINSYSRYNGKSHIQLAIQKQSSANTIQIVDSLKAELARLDRDLGSRGVEFEVIYDHSIFIRQTLKDLAESAGIGALMAFIVLLLFLRNIFSSLLIVITIPLTILGVFGLMSLFKITINIMSLGGLALAIGMIIDTGIVVLENIFRKRQLGDDVETGAISGAEEVAYPVFASCLTGIAVFFPLIVFVPGIPGQMFKDLSWAMVFALVIAMVLPLSLVTMLSTYVRVKPKKDYKPFSITGGLDKFIISRKTVGGQNFVLTIILLIAAGVLISSFAIVPVLDKEVLPKVDQGQFQIKVDMPMGTRLEVTDDTVTQLESVLSDQAEVGSYAVAIGSEKSSRGEVQVETLRSSQALILVSLKEERMRTSEEVIQDLKGSIKSLKLENKNIKVDFVMQSSEFAVAEGGTKPILIEVKGYEIESLERFVDELKKKLRGIAGVVDLQDDRGEKSPETKLNINKKRAALYGISAMDISLTAKTAIEGAVATQFREGGKEIDVRVRLSEADRANIENVENLLLYSQVIDSHVPLKEVAVVESGLGPSEIRRVNQDRTITVSGDIDSSRKSKDVLSWVQSMLAKLEVPEDFRVLLSGKAKEVRENLNSVIFAFVLAIVLVYMIMASQFESFLQPFLIMFTVPMSFCGALVALLVTGGTLNVISLLGLVLLGGTVVNNGIVLIEYMNQRRDEGEPLVEAAWNATRIRTRPVLMTSVTTIIAMLPVAIGSEILNPLAVTVMGGMISSTILTLIILPCIYILVERLFDAPYEDDDYPAEVAANGEEQA